MKQWERDNKDDYIQQDEQEDDESVPNIAGLIMKESFWGGGEAGSSLAIFPTTRPWPPVTGSVSLLSHTQVDTSLPANGHAPHGWEKQLLSKFPGSAPGTRPPHFYNALHLHRVFLWDKWGLSKSLTSQKKKKRKKESHHGASLRSHSSIH